MSLLTPNTRHKSLFVSEGEETSSGKQIDRQTDITLIQDSLIKMAREGMRAENCPTALAPRRDDSNDSVLLAAQVVLGCQQEQQTETTERNPRPGEFPHQLSSPNTDKLTNSLPMSSS
jgi:hypothetical protein